MNVKSSNFVGPIVSGISNSVITIITIIGFGWKIHREIVRDINENQRVIIQNLEDKINQSLSSKLEKEPTSFKLEENQKNIQEVKHDIGELDKKLISVQISVNEIKGILKKKSDLTLK